MLQCFLSLSGLVSFARNRISYIDRISITKVKESHVMKKARLNCFFFFAQYIHFVDSPIDWNHFQDILIPDTIKQIKRAPLPIMLCLR